MRGKTRLGDVAFAVGLFILLLLFFWPVTVGRSTLLPADILYSHQPWRGAVAGGAPPLPHNDLVSDLVLENYVWKRFVIECLRARQLPLWNPYIAGGLPFLAAGQHSALYPLSLIYYLIPLPRAYGLFTVLQLLIAGLGLYFYARTLRLSRLSAAAGGLVFAFSGFFLVSTVFPMILASAAWLPFLLAATERLLAATAPGPGGLRERLSAPLPWLILGSLGLGVQFLAGHAEPAYYNLLVVGAYALCRGLAARRGRALAAFAAAFALMVGLGAALGAVQTIPFYELATHSFREGSATYAQIIGWAYPKRHVLAFLVPDFFGNPTHHSYTDLWSGETVTSLQNALGQPVRTIHWGIKNYVEGGAYVSLVGLALAVVGAWRRPRREVWFFIALGLFSLSLAFGLPTYRLVYILPGIRQLHSPFRWVFPYTACVAVLAAMGAEALAESARSRRGLALPTALGTLAIAGAVGTLAVLGLARALPQRVLPLADRAVAALAKAPEVFADGRMFISYQAPNLLRFAACLLATGLVLLAPRLLPKPGEGAGPGRSAWRPAPYVLRITYYVFRVALLAVLFLDPTLWYRSFQPAADPAPLTMEPPAIRFLRQEPQPFRITVYDTQSAKPLPANTNMLYGLQDVRGYDSIILKTYTDLMKRVGPQELEYNRVARLTEARSLDSPILDLLNVRYVLTEETIDRPGYTLVYDGELRIYRRDRALPRAFVTFRTRVFADRQSLLDALEVAEPSWAVFLEHVPTDWVEPAAPPAAPAVQVLRYGPNEVELRVDMPAAGFLVLADNYFPGWVAYTRPDGETAEQELAIMRAYGTLRAVRLDAGPQTVRFKYSPTSLKLGLFVTFLGAVSLLLLAAAWAWARLYSPTGGEATTRRVAKNTVAPVALQLLNKGIDMAFMMLALRLLGPENAGKYYFAVYVATLFEIVTNFGLNTLLTRQVARNREDGNRYLWNTNVLRLGLVAAAAPLLVLFLLLYRPMPRDTALAILLLGLGLVPSSISAGLSAVFMAFEVMVIPAVVSTVTTLLKVSLGTVVLLGGWGFVGLAGTSIAVNTVTLAILLGLVVALFFRPRPQPEPGLRRELVAAAYPLMLNHLLATLFFKFDVFLLQRLWGETVLGWYSVSYKLVDAVGIIPPAFTMAIFPLMSRLASSSRESLHRAYVLSIKLLFTLALFIALLSTALAYPLAGLMGGGAYLPHSAIALGIIVWYMPLGFINSVTQYVLIALDRQRFLMGAFAVGLASAVVANLLLIPRFGYRAAAAVHILAELALLIPFYVGVRRYLAPVPWARLLWRPLAAAGVAGGFLWLLRSRLALVAPLGGGLYLALVLALGTFGPEDRALLLQVVPLERLWQRLVRRLAPRAP